MSLRAAPILLYTALICSALVNPAAAACFASYDQHGSQAASSGEPAATGASTAGDPQQTVKVSELPPLSISKDWTDLAYWGFTLFLAIIGGFQAYLLWGNLRAIERQAIQMEHQTGILQQSVALAEKNAETARQNLDLFISRERAHLRLELMPLESPLCAGPALVSYKITLHGTTEAYVTGSCARVEITDSSEPVDDGHWFPAMNIPQVITPEHRVVEAQVQGIYPKPALEPADIDAIEAGRRFIHFRGFIKYNDVFGTERWTRCRRVWELSQMRNPDGTRSGRWSRRGGAKDNSET